MLMKPEIQAALQAVGLSPKKDQETIRGKFEEAGLGLEQILSELRGILDFSTSEHLRLRAIENVLKAFGALQPDTAKSDAPQITLIFTGSEAEGSAALNFLKPPANFDEINKKVN